MPRIDETGKKYGKLTVVRFSHKKCNSNLWECQCECGNTIVTKIPLLQSGVVRSCGCPVDNVDTEAEPEAAPINVGQKVRFDPFLETTGFSSEDFRGNYVTGVVVYVNELHKVFWVEYGKPKLRTSFKFCDIGKEVTLRK